MKTRNRTICLAALAILAIIVLACSLMPSQPLSTADNPTAIPEHSNKPSPTPSVLTKTINSSAIKLTEKEVAYCKALAPEDWNFASVPPYVGADLFSPDKNIHAAWGITSIYKTLFPTSVTVLLAVSLPPA